MCKRKPVLLVIFLVAVTAQAAFSQSDKDVRALEDRRIRAMLERDVKTLEEFFAADATYGHGNGLVETGRHLLDRLRPAGDLVYIALDRKDAQARVYKNTALITGTVAIKVRLNGETRDAGTASFLAVWIREKGKWKFAAWQSARAQ